MIGHPASLFIAALIPWLLVPAAALAQPTTTQPSQDELPLVGRVELLGLQRVSETFCRSRIVTAPNRPFSQTILDEDLRRLRRTGRFLDVSADVTVEQGQSIVRFRLEERAVIASIEFRGNEKFSDKELLKLIELQPGDPSSTFAIQRAAGEIEDRYREKGYSDARVRIDDELLRTERRVVFEIEEGPRVRVRRISFEGNLAFEDAELQGKISTKTYFPIFRTGDFNPNTAENDAAEIQNFYHDRGHLDARVGYRTELLEDAGDLALVFLIEEGDLYHVAHINFEGQTRFPADELAAELKLKPGAVMRQDHLVSDLETLKQKYGKLGYLYAVVTPTRTFTPTPAEVVLTFKIQEGRTYSVGRIVVRGNELTRDRVVRRQLDFYPDELFDTSKLKKSEDNIRGTGIFQDAKISPIGDQPDLRDALVDVTEGDHTKIIFGGGIGSNSGLAGTLSFESRNFDLFDWPRSWSEAMRFRSFRGAGQFFRAELSPGTEVSSFRIDFREPFFLYRPLTLGTSFYLWERGREEYDERRIGFVPSLGKTFESGLLKGWAGEISLRTEQVRIDDLDSFPAEDIRDAEGANLLLSAQGRLVRNRTDQRFNPTKGDVWSFSYEQAFAEDIFGKIEGSYRWYKTVRIDEEDRPDVLGLRAEAGYILGVAPVYERFYAGGLGSLRGFEYRGISPRDGPFFDDDQRIGGGFDLLAGAEYSFPVYARLVRGVIFSDMGTVEEDLEIDTWRASVGVGIRIYIEAYLGPIPIEFNFAAPVAKDDDDDTQVFSFAIGVSF